MALKIGDKVRLVPGQFEVDLGVGTVISLRLDAVIRVEFDVCILDCSVSLQHNDIYQIVKEN